jgi:hypothetical protein
VNEAWSREALAVTTALAERRGQGLAKLAASAGQSLAATGAAIAWLEERGWVEAVGKRGRRDGFGLTLTGLEAFYATLGEIRDVLSSRQPASSLPFTLQTVWKEVLCFNYLVEPAVLRPLIPPVFDLVTFSGRAMVSVVAASLRSLRPQGFPEIAGRNFCHLTHRAVVRFVNRAGEERRGYHFTASLTNSDLLSRIGNSVTEFRFHRFQQGSITFLESGSKLVLGVEAGSPDHHLVATVDLATAREEVPPGSAFGSREELDRELLDHREALGHAPGQRYVYVLGIERDPWRYRFVEPFELYLAYFQEGRPFDAQTARLDSVLHCREVAYRWLPLEREALAEPPPPEASSGIPVL